MEDGVPDIWSYCEPCGRWFYSPAADTEASATQCPVCAEPATRSVDRAEPRRVTQEPVA